MANTPVKIAWLGLLDSDDATGSSRAHEHLATLARHIVAAAGHGWSIELVSCGDAPGRRPIRTGVDRLALPVAGVARTVWDRTSWDLSGVIAEVDLVHLHDGFSRSCEVALLIARQLRKPVCMTEWGIEGHWLTSELSLIELADVVVCHDRAVAESISTSKQVELVACETDIRQLGVPAPWPANHCLPLGPSRACERRPATSRRQASGVRRQDESGDAAPVASCPKPDASYATAGLQLYEIYHRLIAATRRAAA